VLGPTILVATGAAAPMLGRRGALGALATGVGLVCAAGAVRLVGSRDVPARETGADLATASGGW